jgi:hypothetical protein
VHKVEVTQELGPLAVIETFWAKEAAFPTVILRRHGWHLVLGVACLKIGLEMISAGLQLRNGANSLEFIP